jgi:hypothetical protein
VVQEHRDHGLNITPGKKIRYIVTDAQRCRVEPAWNAIWFDLAYYRVMIQMV